MLISSVAWSALSPDEQQLQKYLDTNTTSEETERLRHDQNWERSVAQLARQNPERFVEIFEQRKNGTDFRTLRLWKVVNHQCTGEVFNRLFATLVLKSSFENKDTGYFLEKIRSFLFYRQWAHEFDVVVQKAFIVRLASEEDTSKVIPVFLSSVPDRLLDFSNWHNGSFFWKKVSEHSLSATARARLTREIHVFTQNTKSEEALRNAISALVYLNPEAVFKAGGFYDDWVKERDRYKVSVVMNAFESADSSLQIAIAPIIVSRYLSDSAQERESLENMLWAIGRENGALISIGNKQRPIAASVEELLVKHLQKNPKDYEVSDFLYKLRNPRPPKDSCSGFMD